MKLIIKLLNLNHIIANICDNTFYAYSDNIKNIEHILDFFNKEFANYGCDEADFPELNIYFESKWVFPEELMNKLFEGIPNKDDIYMRCLSVEYGTDYVAYYKCDKTGWKQIV